MSRKQKLPLNEFLNRFGTEESYRDPSACTSPTAAVRLPSQPTVLHHSHVSLSKWILAFYFVLQDK